MYFYVIVKESVGKFHINLEYDINFHLSIVGIGIDIEDIGRFKVHLEQRDQRFFERLFSKEEIDYCMSKKHPEAHFAARFCAKEAFVKASVSQEKFNITDVHVLKEGNQPMIEIWQKESNKVELIKFFEAYAVMLSLSHSKAYACAQVIIQNKNE